MDTNEQPISTSTNLPFSTMHFSDQTALNSAASASSAVSHLAKRKRLSVEDEAIQPGTSADMYAEQTATFTSDLVTEMLKPIAWESVGVECSSIIASRQIINIDVLSSHDFLVFVPTDVEVLKKEYRMICSREKTDGAGSLLPEQAQILVENAACDSSYETIESPVFPCTADHFKRLTVFRDLWRKGFYLTAGTKFGCDYLAYEQPPGVDHSKFMVICLDSSSDSLKPLDLISISRVSSQVKKKLLLAVVTPGNLLPYYIKANWWKGDR